MFESWRLSHVLRVVGFSAVILWLVVHFSGSAARPRLDALYSGHTDERSAFVKSFLENDIDGPFNGSAIEALCASKTWTPGLLLTCEAVPGELGDVKNGVLNCIRIAIEMGAEVILPQIMQRSLVNYADIAPGDKGPRRGAPLGYFFDEAHLDHSLATLCPQMKIHPSLDVFYDNPKVLSATRLDLFRTPNITLANNIKGSGGRVLDHPEELGMRIHAYLDEVSPPKRRTYPFHVNLRPTPRYLFPAADPALESADLYLHFGRLLRVRADLRQVAATVLFNLRKAFGLEDGLDPARGIDIDAFVGVELRTQRDPMEAVLPPYTVQASDALAFVTAHNMTLVYLGEGATRANATAFADRCEDFHVTVVSKEDLVDDATRAMLSKLRYDERFLVDYEVMLRSGLFVGGARSSFAWNVALRRKNAFGDPGRADAGHLVGSIRWHDQYSTLYGKEGESDEIRRTVWP